jgi:hypothetical protein
MQSSKSNLGGLQKMCWQDFKQIFYSKKYFGLQKSLPGGPGRTSEEKI